MIAFPQPAQKENAPLFPLSCRILSKLLKELHQANFSFSPSAEGDLEEAPESRRLVRVCVHLTAALRTPKWRPGLEVRER